jgi:hypothetical protein
VFAPVSYFIDYIVNNTIPFLLKTYNFSYSVVAVNYFNFFLDTGAKA